MPRKYSILEHVLFWPTWLNEKKLHERLKGKTILITGASYGIGECLARLLASVGVQLLLVARTEEKLLQIQKELQAKGAAVSVFAIDLTKEVEVENLLNALPKKIDIVVSNAGKSIMRSVYKALDRLHDYKRTMGVNYFGPVQLLLGLIPILEKNKGQVINISAVNTLLPPAPYWSAYQASKTAFDHWFRCVVPEVNARGIATTSIYLPLVKTRMIAPTKAYQHTPAMNPEHVARIIAKSILTKRRIYTPWWLIFGQLASVLFRGIWEWLLPVFIRNKE